MKKSKNMKLTVKTIKGEAFKIDVELYNTVNLVNMLMIFKDLLN